MPFSERMQLQLMDLAYCGNSPHANEAKERRHVNGILLHGAVPSPSLPPSPPLLQFLAAICSAAAEKNRFHRFVSGGKIFSAGVGGASS